MTGGGLATVWRIRRDSGRVDPSAAARRRDGVLIGVIAAIVVGGLGVDRALSGFGEPSEWLLLGAMLMARALTDTGLSRRVALLFVRRFWRDLAQVRVFPRAHRRHTRGRYPVDLREIRRHHPADRAKRRRAATTPAPARRQAALVDF